MGSRSEIPALPGPIIKVICSFLPISARCEARLVSRSWRLHAGEAVQIISLSASQLKKQVFADFTPWQVQQQLQKAAAAEAAAAGATAIQAKAAAATVQLSAYVQPRASRSSSSTGLHKRRNRHAASFAAGTSSRARQQRELEHKSVMSQRQLELNELFILAVARRIAAAFPAADTAVLLLEVGDYGDAAGGDPAVVARQVLLLLSQCRQLARLRIQVTALGTGQHQHEQQQQPEGQQQQHEQAGPAAAAVPLPAWVQQQQPVAAALAAAQAAAAAQDNVGAGEDADDDDLLGFDADDADYCYGWIARLLQHLQQQQQQGLVQGRSFGSSSSISSAIKLKRQMLQPVLLWKDTDLQHYIYHQHQHLWSSDIAAVAAAGSSVTTSSSNMAAAAPAAPVVPFVIEVRIVGAAYPRSASDWQQLCAVTGCASLLLPEHRPALLPAMVKDGLAGVTQLRALHISVDAGYTAAAAALQWGVGGGAAGSDITSLGQLTRLTHLSLHSQGCSMRDITASLVSLTALRELLLSGNSAVLLPAMATRLTQLQLLVLQQQLSLFELNLLTQRCPRLRHLETLGVTEAAGAAHNLGVYDALVPTQHVRQFVHAVAIAASTLLGPAADSLSREMPHWLTLPQGCSTGTSSNSSGQTDTAYETVLEAACACDLRVTAALHLVAVAFYSDAEGDAGRAAAASKLSKELDWQSGGDRNQPQAAAASTSDAPPLRPEQQQQHHHTRGFVDPRAPGVWWCQLLAAQDDLKQALMTHAVNKMLMAEQVESPLLLMHSRDTTPAVSVISLLQLVAAGARAAGAAAVAAGMNADPGALVVVQEDNMPAGAVEDLLDELLSAAPFGPPGDTTQEQQQQDLAAEEAAAAAWRTQQHMLRQQLQQQQQEEEEGPVAAATAPVEDPDELLPGTDAAAVGAEDPGGAGAAGNSGSRTSHQQALLDQHIDWDSYALSLQRWLQHRYSSGTTSSDTSSSSSGSSSSAVGCAAAANGSVHAVKRFVSWLSSGSDLSLLCAALPCLEALELAVPPSLAALKPAHRQQPPTETLQQVQLWMGSSSNLAFAAQSTGSSSTSGSAEDQVTAAKHSQWQQQILQTGANFSASYLAEQRQAMSLHAPSSSGIAPPLPGPACYFAHLSRLTVSNLSQPDGPWEPSTLLGDACLAAAALGCPALECLEVCGVLCVSAAGLLLLRRARRLKKLRLEQWAKTTTELSAQQLPLAVWCLPPGLTQLTLINVHPLTHIHTLAALAAAIMAAGGVQGVKAAAQTEAAAAVCRGGAAVDIAAMAAAAEAVIAAAASEQMAAGISSQQQQQAAPFLGLGIACRSSAATSNSNADSIRSSSSSSKQLLGSREWLTPAAVALLLLNTFFGSSGFDSAGIQQSLASLRCCCHCRVCRSHTRSSVAPSDSVCCVSLVFQDLEDLTVMAHRAGGGDVCGGLHPFLAAGLPHARALQHVHVAAPGAFSSLPPSDALLYGALTAANTATLHTLSAPLAAAATAALQAGAFDTEASLLQRTRRLLTSASTAVSSSAGAAAAARGSLSSSYAWLRCLGGLPVLADVHLDLPLMMPGQLSTLVSAVSQSSSVSSLRLHGVAITLHTPHRDVLNIMSQLTATAAPRGKQQQRSGHHTTAAVLAAVEREADEEESSSSRSSNMLRVLDVSFTKHTVLPPMGLSLSRSWSAVKAERAAAAAAQQLTVLQQMKELLSAARHHIAAAAAGPAGAAAGAALPPAAVVAMDIAMQMAGGAAGGINQQQLQQWGQMLAQAAEAQGPQPAAAAGDPVAGQVVGPLAFAQPAPAHVFVLLSNLLLTVDHQIHRVTYHQQPAAPFLVTHAAAASAADKQLVRVLQGTFKRRGVAQCTVTMHGSSPRDAAVLGYHGRQGEGAGWAAAPRGRAAAAAGVADSDVTDVDDFGSDSLYTSFKSDDPHSSGVGQAGNGPLELQLNFRDRSGLSGVAEGLGSSFMAMYSAFLHWLTGLGPRIQGSRFWGREVAFRVWLLTRNVVVGGAVTALVAVLAAAVYLGWDDGLEGFIGRSSSSRVGQQQHDIRDADDDAGGGVTAGCEQEDSSSWEEEEEGSTDGSGDPSGGDGGRDHGDSQNSSDVDDAVAADSDMLEPAAGPGNGPVGLGDDPAGHVDFIEQGIQDLLYHDGGVPVPDADVHVTGGVTGVPAQVQVLGQADSTASVGFLLGAVPVCVLAVWGGYRQARWILGRLIALLGSIVMQLV